MHDKPLELKMKLPRQAPPVDRQASRNVYGVGGLVQSGNCNCPNACIGACVFDHCQGVCV
jgi:hypothetical protein